MRILCLEEVTDVTGGIYGGGGRGMYMPLSAGCGNLNVSVGTGGISVSGTLRDFSACAGQL